MFCLRRATRARTPTIGYGQSISIRLMILFATLFGGREGLIHAANQIHETPKSFICFVSQCNQALATRRTTLFL
jgi:hypothetical protein